MTDSLVERLRRWPPPTPKGVAWPADLLFEAADRIEALTAALLVIAHAPIPPHLGPAHELTNIAKRALEAK